ncbi:MAG: GNAT family N-acetyltransferase [Clostridia bacterium]|nr:GNAT family N-acetyltransferase [Clostridia bacterium]
MNLQKICNTTLQFYSCFCGTDLATLTPGIHFVCTEERDVSLKGFGCKYTLFLLVSEDSCVISYSPKYCHFVDSLKSAGINEILFAIRQKQMPKHMRLFTFGGEAVFDYRNAKILEPTDYSLFASFFRKAYPTANPDGWLYDYFTEKTEKEYMAGYIENGVLVSVCDAPDMPYMENLIQHTGIMTLPDYRNKGYAKSTAALSTHHLLENGVCPQWECHAKNIASINLARTLGYQDFAQAYIWEENP